MDNITIFTLQEKLRKMPCVSVPQIQQDFGLTYKEAKVFLRELLDRGWVGKEPEGNCYPIMKDLLCLRNIHRSEVDDLIEDVDMNCVSVLQTVLKAKGEGVDFGDITFALDDEDDAQKTLQLLLKNRLLYERNGQYYICVSAKVVSVLSDVARIKRGWELGRRIAGRDVDKTKTKRLFETLF